MSSHAAPSSTAEDLARSLRARPYQGGWMARCPAHDDRTPSLSVSEREGRILVYCHAGCSQADVIAALDARGLWPGAPRANNGGRTVVSEYVYRDENGRPLFRVCRTAAKDFYQQRFEGGQWVNGLSRQTRRVLYNLPRVLSGRAVYLCEGEKDADAVGRLGLGATTAPGGAGKWRREYTESLRGKDMVILPDADEPGREHARQVARSLLGAAASVRVLELPGLAEGGDVSDWLDRGGTAEELERLVSQTPETRPEDVPETEPAREPAGLDEANVAKVAAEPLWPEPLGEAAYYGLAGDIVRTIEPHSEADPAALLVQLLVAYGSVIGRQAYFQVEADKHHSNLFAVVVGATSKARKGTSWGHVRRLMGSADEVWARDRVPPGGLSSGEGLIWAVRDEVWKREKARKGKETVYEDVLADPGVEDKRLLVVESEFANVLRVCERQANTLSAVIRQAWDVGTLERLTKNSPAKATGAHVSIVGHITADELKRELTDTATANGFANRFLLVCARRSKLLPSGGKLHTVNLNLAPLIRGLVEAVEHGRQISEVDFDHQAGRMWDEVYGPLSEGRPGLLGAITGRGEAQVVRLSLIYALLDRADAIRAEHLEAALAVWQYCQASAAHIFGNSLGDATADRLLEALRRAPEGMTRTQMRDLFGRHRSSADVGRALALIERLRLAQAEQVDTGGVRPAEVWRAL